jgi:hypothetical protein
VDGLTITPGGDGAASPPTDRVQASLSEEGQMRLLNIVTSPRKERSASIAVTDSFLLEYQKRIKGVVVDTLDVWTESLSTMSPLDRRSRTVPLAAGWTYVSL